MDNFGEQLNLVIDKLSEKLGVAADAIMPMMIKQATIQGVLGIISVIVFFVLLFLSLRIIILTATKVDEEECVDMEVRAMAKFIIFGILGFFSFIGFLVSIISIPNTFSALFNQEYWALQEIMKMVTR